jgi:hypothetical protein
MVALPRCLYGVGAPVAGPPLVGGRNSHSNSGGPRGPNAGNIGSPPGPNAGRFGGGGSGGGGGGTTNPPSGSGGGGGGTIVRFGVGVGGLAYGVFGVGVGKRARNGYTTSWPYLGRAGGGGFPGKRIVPGNFWTGGGVVLSPGASPAGGCTCGGGGASQCIRNHGWLRN